jgi:hypothetical protein
MIQAFLSAQDGAIAKKRMRKRSGACGAFTRFGRRAGFG